MKALFEKFLDWIDEKERKRSCQKLTKQAISLTNQMKKGL